MLSPLELENKRILTSKRKYDRLEMDEYLDMVFENYKALFNEYEEQKKQIKTLTDGIQYYRSIESTMQKALLLAEKTSKETKDAAILKAEAIEKDANNKASQIITTAEQEYSRIREKCLALVQQFNHYKAQLQVAANEQLRLITSATFEVETPEIADQAPVAQPEAPSMMAEMTADSLATAEPAAPAVKENTAPEIPSSPAMDISFEAQAPQQAAPEAFAPAEEPQAEEQPVQQKSSVYTFSSSGTTQPLPDLSAATATSVNEAPAQKPVIPTPAPVAEPTPEPMIPTPEPVATPEPEIDISAQFEMYADASASDLQPKADPVPDKTMVLPDVKSVDREALRGNKAPMTEAEQQSLLSAETINLGDSIRAVRDQEQEVLTVPQKQEPQVLELEPADPEVQMQPQGLDSILQNITIGKKKKTNGDSAEDPFEFLGSVDDF